MKGYKNIAAAIALWSVITGGTAEAAAEDALLQTGKAAMAANDYGKAYEAYTEVIAQNDKLAAAFAGRARAAKRLGKIEECVRDLSLAISLEPANATYWFNRGCVYQEYNYLQEAVADFLKSVELEPKGLYPLISLVKAYQDLEDFAQAATYADQMLALFAGNDYVLADDVALDKGLQSMMYVSAASAYHHLGGRDNNERAMSLCDQALALDGMSFWGLMQRASVYLALDNPEAALKDCDRAMELGRDKSLEPLCLFLRSGIFHSQKKDSEALQDINRCIAMSPDFRDAYLERADIYCSLNDREKAMADGQKYLELGGKREKLSDSLKEMLGR